MKTCTIPLRWVIGVILALALNSAQAAGPELMTYQGFLVDANGQPLATNNPANYPVIFRIFATQSGGTPLWSEQQIVTVDNGNFSALVGEGTPVTGELRPSLSTLFAGPGSENRYMSLSVTIGGATQEMLPRLRLLPAPYAFQATTANYLVDSAGGRVISVGAGGLDVTGGVNATGALSVGGVLTAASLNVTGQTVVNSPFVVRPQGGNEGGEIVLQGTGGTNPEWRLDTLLNQVRLHSGGSTKFSVDTLGNTLLTGNLGLGVATPASRLHINGGIKVEGSGNLEFGSGIAGKQQDAGRMGYQLFSADSLDIVGAGTTPGNRKVRVWAEGGADFTGAIIANGAVRARGGAPGGNGALNNGFSFTGNNGDIDSGMFSSADGQVEFYGNSLERMRIDPAGLVGIGTPAPTARLEVNGDVKITGANPLEFGAGVAGKELNAGKIGYQVFTQGALDIVGAGTTGANRRVNVFAEGGSAFTGNIGVRTATPQDGVHVSGGGALRVDALVNGAARYVRMYRVPEGLVLEGNLMRNPNMGGAQGIGRVVWDGDGNLDSFSDRRLKKDIADAEEVLERVMEVQVRRFHWTDQGADDPKKFGVIAQELEPHFPDLVSRATDPEGGEPMLTVKGGAFGLIAVKALQELKAEKDSEVAALREEVDELKQEVAQLKGQLLRTAQSDTVQRELESLKQIVAQLSARPTGESLLREVSSTTEAIASR